MDRQSLFAAHPSMWVNLNVIIPRNTIWGDVLMKFTGAPARRLSIEVEVRAEDHDVESSEGHTMHVMKAYSDVLSSPAPTLSLSALSAESLTFSCCHLATTQNKDGVRW